MRHRPVPTLLVTALAFSACGGPGVPTEALPAVFPRVDVVPCADPLDAIRARCPLTATVFDSAGVVVSDPEIVWSVDETTVVRITVDGVLRAVANGRTFARARWGAVEGALEVEVRQVAVSVSKASGDAQVGAPGTLLAEPLVAVAMDRLGHPVAGVSVFYRVTRGTGALSSASATTDPAGRAQVRWTLGPEPGNQTVVASVRPGEETPAQYTAIAR